LEVIGRILNAPKVGFRSYRKLTVFSDPCQYIKAFPQQG
jgi:hypothetical protein